jgi:predicted SprT family Zn-dependent metalloprotease
MTPHQRPSTDAFWNQGFIDDWNEVHTSPRKLFSAAARLYSPTKPVQESRATGAVRSREQKKAFDKIKHGFADEFLCELDKKITAGKIAGLTESTGGITIRWTNKLNTTAGRAIWKRETIRSRSQSRETDGQGGDSDSRHRHHASIEVAEKVIDDEHRLLNVIAHEFCHLATFIMDGVTTKPHGAEFKAWASRCNEVFAQRGVQVTTKHSYDIAYKYVWTCDTCAAEYKRHSKSIDVSRHRCGSCKGELRQTKPVPRAPAKPSRYQNFLKEQMRVLKEQNPSSPQKEIMRMVASEWSRQSAPVENGNPASARPESNETDDLVGGMDALQIAERATTSS